MRNKKGMLGDIIVIFIIIFIGTQLAGVVSQEVSNMNCNSTNMTNISVSDNPNLKPIGTTNSFGGAGSGQFGGYDGQVKKSWEVKDLSLYKTDYSMFNSNCEEISEGTKQLMSILPLVIYAFIFLIGGYMIWNIFRREVD